MVNASSILATSTNLNKSKMNRKFNHYVLIVLTELKEIARSIHTIKR